MSHLPVITAYQAQLENVHKMRKQMEFSEQHMRRKALEWEESAESIRSWEMWSQISFQIGLEALISAVSLGAANAAKARYLARIASAANKTARGAQAVNAGIQAGETATKLHAFVLKTLRTGLVAGKNYLTKGEVASDIGSFIKELCLGLASLKGMDESMQIGVDAVESMTKAAVDAIPKAAAQAGARGMQAALKHDYSKEIGWQGRYIWGSDQKLKQACVRAAQCRAMQKVYDRGVDIFFDWEQDLKRLIPELESMARSGVVSANNTGKRRPLWPRPRRK